MITPKNLLLSVVISGILLNCHSARSAPTPEQTKFFEEKVKPVLTESCFKCHSHSADKIKGSLVVDSLSGLLKGGDSGPAIVPGQPEKSLLVKAIRYKDEDLQMPPKGKKLPAHQVADLEKWVQMGAPWPGADVANVKVRGKITDEDRSWWAFQPVKPQPVPKVADSSFIRNPIDNFVVARLARERLEHSGQAERRILIKRVYLDLWGLLPKQSEVEAFAADPSPFAYERLVDRLLDHPHYGERWARHWLDLVRFAESDGYKADGFRPSAWRYRDYVIRSFNHDKPYDQFVKEQLAGDELDPENPDAITGTMFARHGIYEYNNPDARGQWDAILNELTDVTADVFVGVGLSCARCHDHKFDPILQKDYYRFQAFFAPLTLRDDVQLASLREKQAYAKKLAVWQDKTREIREQIDAIENDYRTKNLRKAAQKFPEDVQDLLCKPAAERSIYEEQIVRLAYLQVLPAFEQIETKLKDPEKEKLIALKKQLAQFDKEKPQPLPDTMAISDIGPEAPPIHIPKSRIKDPIEPGFLSVLDERPAKIRKVATAPNSTGRRAALAEWITDPRNPLTARVFVNRLWQEHFGRGLVATTSDFGKLGQAPSHPELLDWLAAEFVRNGWSVKKIQKLILTSATYRQASSHAPAQLALKKDPENILLWRQNIRRMDADQVRDALLSVSGELDLTMSGPSADSSKARRTIYTKVRRNTHDPLLQAFDAPDNISSTPQRNITTTAPQALLMFNSQAVLHRARALAGKLISAHPSNDDALVQLAVREILGRNPESWETEELVQFLRAQRARIARDAAIPKPVPFVAEPLPARDGKAALIDREGPSTRFEVPEIADLPDEDFTIEAVIMLKSLGETGVRTIAAHWPGVKTQTGWALGVTGKKGVPKPQHLVLELASNAAKGGSHETIVSGLQLDLNKTYYVAASVRRGDTNEGGVTFYLKNLANDEEASVSKVAHQMTTSGRASVPFTIGAVGHENPEYQFQGLVDEVRLTSKALAPEQLLIHGDEPPAETAGYWQLKSEKDFFKDRSPHGRDIQRQLQEKRTEPARAALEDLCHTLMNSNEFFYID